MFAEDLGAFFDVAGGFADPATVNGGPHAVIFERDALVTDEQILAEYSVLLPAAVLVAQNQVVVVQSGAGAGTYRVRQVLPEPPDAVLNRLVLVKA